MVIFVIGANATGKSSFIERNFRDRGYVLLDVFDYQKRLEKEERVREPSAYREQLFRANDQLRDDIVDLVRQGRDVVVEHTLLRALRRIGFVEAIRAASQDVSIEVYAMTPSDGQLRRNCEARVKETGGSAEAEFQRVKREISEVFEFPNPAEGFTRICAVTDGAVTESTEEPDFSRIARAKEELRAEDEKRAAKRQERERHEALVRRMEHIRFWHYCEICGKKELLTADEAFDQGWDYPPRMYQFRQLGPRTCGNCCMAGTVYWKLVTAKKAWVELTENEKETLARIRSEPESLMPAEEDF